MRSERGMSLIEMMIAVMIVGVLASMAGTGLAKNTVMAKRPEAYLGLSTISRMQDAFFTSRGYYASTLDELGYTMDHGIAPDSNTWIGRRYTFSITPLSSGQGYVATAVGNLDGDVFQDILFATR
jgi:prepilin-type N-terminal cleavage/methylation domain-containing protein